MDKLVNCLRYNPLNLWPLVGLIVITLGLKFGSLVVFESEEFERARELKTQLDRRQASHTDRILSNLSEVTAKMKWCVAGVNQTLVFVVAIVLFYKQIKACSGNSNISSRSLRWLLFVLAAIPAILWLVAPDRGLPPGGMYLSELLDHVVERKQMLQWLITFENFLTLCLISTGLTAVCMTLFQAGAATNATALRAEVASIRPLLTIATVALMFGTIQVYFEYRWVAAQFLHYTKHGELHDEVVQSAFSSMILVASVFLSMVLAAVFLPAAVVLWHYASQINQKTIVPSQRLSFSPADFVFDFLKIAGPILTAGPLSALLSR